MKFVNQKNIMCVAWGIRLVYFQVIVMEFASSLGDGWAHYSLWLQSTCLLFLSTKFY